MFVTEPENLYTSVIIKRRHIFPALDMNNGLSDPIESVQVMYFIVSMFNRREQIRIKWSIYQAFGDNYGVKVKEESIHLKGILEEMQTTLEQCIINLNCLKKKIIIIQLWLCIAPTLNRISLFFTPLTANEMLTIKEKLIQYHLKQLVVIIRFDIVWITHRFIWTSKTLQ